MAQYGIHLPSAVDTEENPKAVKKDDQGCISHERMGLKFLINWLGTLYCITEATFLATT